MNATTENIPFPHVPAPPAWNLAASNWDALVARFAWLRTMAGVPQDPEYHTEGDVLTHTRMVVAATVGSMAWRDAPEGERAVRFAAALLHDVAKPATTREEGGRVVSPGHARRGEILARAVLYTGDGFDAPVPFAARERIAALVRFHGLPLWFLDRDDPARAITTASQRVSLDWVADLAEADVRGRICADSAELLARVGLFRDYCAELGCLTGPRPFPSDAARFAYCSGRSAYPDYDPYDDSLCEVVLMSGLPGAGKDTWVETHLPGLPVVSLDAIRKERGIAPTGPQGTVVQAAKEAARVHLRQGRSFVWNATNITRALRGPLVELCIAYRARVRVVYVEVAYATLLARNAARGADALPDAALRRLVNRVELPDATEAHAVTHAVQG